MKILIQICLRLSPFWSNVFFKVHFSSSKQNGLYVAKLKLEPGKSGAFVVYGLRDDAKSLNQWYYNVGREKRWIKEILMRKFYVIWLLSI